MSGTNWRSGLIERVEEDPTETGSACFRWNCFESQGHPATPDAVVRVLSQGSQAEALRVFSDQILPSFISSAWGRNFERQGAVQGARHPVRRGRLATLALYS
ncbi:MAG: hypothetical protein DMG26_09860 [Acidobacteria bacterium]|nr:MAG: hypothetical protein DMG26_09860 [Acidobacteriota bacterium]